MLRKLVTIRQIHEIAPIPEADSIEVASIEGWKVVVKKGEYKVGDFCMYYEIDSFLPAEDKRYHFLMEKRKQTFEGKKGHKLRTIKLKDQLSQGLALRLEEFPELSLPESVEQRKALRSHDFAKQLKIKKFELPVPASLHGVQKGEFPSFIKKTDQERCQNFADEIFVDNKDARYEVTLKLDGTSVTYYQTATETGACSRNFEMSLGEENKDNTIVKLLKESGLAKVNFKGYALQGELMGGGIQCNREHLKTHCLYLFDIQNLATKNYLTPTERYEFLENLYQNEGLSKEHIKHIPVLEKSVTLEELGIYSMDDLIDYAEGPSIKSDIREGVVFKRLDNKFSFKVMNNRFLQQGQ